MIEDVLARVERRLVEVGLSATAASKAAGLGEDAIRNMRRAAKEGARRGVSTRTMAALAPVLKTTSGWLIDGEGEEAAAAPKTVPVVGYIGAGDAAHFYSQDQGELERVEPPPSTELVSQARQVRGPSIGRYFDGWLVFTGERQPGVPDVFIGELCEVHLPDDRVLVKWVRRSKAPGFFDLYSETEDPMVMEEVDWSAKVVGMTPR